MNSPLAALLTVVSCCITIAIACYIAIGAHFAVAFAFICVGALAAWLIVSKRLAAGATVVSPQLLTIVAAFVLASFQYLGNMPALLSTTLGQPSANHVVLTDFSWLAAFVILPAVLMLMGAYFVIQRSPLGSYMAWWTALYAIGAGLFHYRLEIANGASWNPLHIGAALAALGLMLLGTSTMQCLLGLSPALTDLDVPAPRLSDRQRNLWTVLFISLVVMYGMALYTQSGLLPVGVIGASMAGGLVGWRKTTARYPANRAKVVPLFLLLLALFYVHMGEEALAPLPFNRAIAALSGTPWSDRDFVLTIGLMGPVAWTFAAWSLWKQRPFGNFILWFLIVGMVLGEPTHILVFPVVAMYKFGIGYRYFAGMYTALFSMIPAILALSIILSDRKERLKTSAQ